MSTSDAYQSFNIQYTTSHLYSALLGTGSSCDVYKGLQKGTGKIRALKIFKKGSWDREREKEAAALAKLKYHSNIIQYHGQEKDFSTNRPVLIFEYCNGGSLHTYLKEIENRHGLQDSEFLVLLGDLTSGLEHLQLHNCIHRDIKPGNILRHTASSGRCIFKLSDFGASRLLTYNGEQFHSIAGTEEYLHPAMYETAFVNKDRNAKFNESADLWSLGCTLYQAASGKMPFIPYDGARKDRATMYEMITCKPHGAIAGSQTNGHSAVEWHRKLPSESNITASLRSNLEPLLVGLLQADPSKHWSLIEYNHAAKSVIKLKLTYVINCDERRLYHFYLNPESSFAEFQDELACKTDILASNQKLYYQQQGLQTFLKHGTSVQYFPPTCLQIPIILFSNVTETEIGFKLTLDPYPSFHSTSSITDDIEVATKQCETMCIILNKMVEIQSVLLGLHEASLTMIINYQNKHYRLEKKYHPWFEIYKHLRWLFDNINDLDDKQGGIKSQCEAISLFKPIYKFYNTLKQIKCGIVSTSDVGLKAQPVNFHLDNNWCKIAEKLFQQGKCVLKRMQNRKKNVVNEFEHINQLSDRIEMQELTAQCVNLWQTSCDDDRKRISTEYSENKRLYVTKLQEMVNIEKQLNNFKVIKDEFDQNFKKMIHFLVGYTPDKPKMSKKKPTGRMTQRALSDIQVTPEEYSIKETRSSPLLRRQSSDLVNEMKAQSLNLKQSIERFPSLYEIEVIKLEEIGETPNLSNEATCSSSTLHYHEFVSTEAKEGESGYTSGALKKCDRSGLSKLPISKLKSIGKADLGLFDSGYASKDRLKSSTVEGNLETSEISTPSNKPEMYNKALFNPKNKSVCQDIPKLKPIEKASVGLFDSGYASKDRLKSSTVKSNLETIEISPPLNIINPH